MCVCAHGSVCAHVQQAKHSFFEKAKKAEVCQLRLLIRSRLPRPERIAQKLY